MTVLVSDDKPLDVIAKTSAYSSVSFVGLAVGKEDTHPLDQYAELIGALRGNVLLAKSWHDLDL